MTVARMMNSKEDAIMDDGRLDTLERQLAGHGRLRAQKAVLPGDFTARVMADIRRRSDRPKAFLDIFTGAATRFAPAGAIAAGALYGYAAHADRLLSQALLGLSLSGASLAGYASLLP